MKRSKSYTWLSGLLRPREEKDAEEWGAAAGPWVRADVMHHDRYIKMAGFNKVGLLLVVVACMMLVATELALAVHVGPCDQVCGRTDPEKDECCRAHGHTGYLNGCDYGHMNCY